MPCFRDRLLQPLDFVRPDTVHVEIRVVQRDVVEIEHLDGHPSGVSPRAASTSARLYDARLRLPAMPRIFISVSPATINAETAEHAEQILFCGFREVCVERRGSGKHARCRS